MDAEIEFLKDDKGSVTHLILHQGAAEIKLRGSRARTFTLCRGYAVLPKIRIKLD